MERATEPRGQSERASPGLERLQKFSLNVSLNVGVGGVETWVTSDLTEGAMGVANAFADVRDAVGLGPSPVLVEDQEEPEAGQIRRRDFLGQVRPAVTAICDAELVAAGRSADGCPYLQRVFGRLEDRPARHVERAARRYVGGAASSADALVAAVVARAGAAVRQWVAQGTPEIPEDRLLMARRGPTGPTASGARPDQVRTELGPGRPLDSGVRGRLEHGFGTSLAHVRLHEHEVATRWARSLDARAFTVGNHVALGAGAPRPGTVAGDLLLAHEVAHTLQQRGSERGGADADLERAADRRALTVVGPLYGVHVDAPAGGAGALAGGLRLQRCGHGYAARTPAALAEALPVVTALQGMGVLVREDDANWSATQLQYVQQALDGLSPAELAVIAGITFVRVARVQATGGGHQADAMHKVGVVRDDSGQWQGIREIHLGNGIQFSGLVTLLTHELGHVIEMTDAHAAQLRHNQAIDALNAASPDALNASREALRAALDAAQNRRANYSAADIASAEAYSTALGLAITGYTDLFSSVQSMRDASSSAPGTAAERALVMTLQGRDTAWSQLQASHAQHPALTDYGPLNSALDQAVADLRAQVVVESEVFDAKDALAAVQTQRHGHDVSNRLAAFIDLVDQHDFGPLTWANTRSSYTAEVLAEEGRTRFYQEMFADAFAMWRREPASLQSQAPQLVTFFDQGRHLQ